MTEFQILLLGTLLLLAYLLYGIQKRLSKANEHLSELNRRLVGVNISVEHVRSATLSISGDVMRLVHMPKPSKT